MNVKITGGLCGVAALLLACAANADDEWATIADGVLTFNVATNVSETYATAIPSTVTSMVKTGEGTVTLTGDNSAFTGTIEVVKGILAGTSAKRFGPTASGKYGAVYVREGATLDVTEPSSQADESLRYRELHLAGEGFSGTGAICRATGAKGDYLLGSVVLDGDATLYGVGGRIGIGYSAASQSLDLGGHTLTLAGSAQKLVYCSIVNPGHIVCGPDAGQFVFQNGGNKINGDASNTFTLQPGSNVQLWGSTYNGGYVPWTLVSLGASTLSGGAAGAATARNHWAGPILINGTSLTLDVVTDKARNLTVTGDITASSNATAMLYKSNNGVAWLKDNTMKLNGLAVQKSDLHIENSDVTISNNTVVGSTAHTSASGYIPTLTLTNTIWRGRCKTPGTGNAVSRIYVGSDSKNWGTMTIDDSIVSNDFFVAYQAGSFGAVYQRGESSYVWWPAGPSNDGRIGNGAGGYGYWGLTDGTLDIYAHTSLGLNVNSQGIIVQRGGLIKMRTSSWKLSKGGYGEICVLDGGTFQGGSSFTFGSQDYSSTSGGTGIVTCAGADTKFTVGSTYFFWRTNFVAQININDGALFTCDYFIKKNAAVKTEGLSKGWISFNGGTFAFTGSSEAGMDDEDIAPNCAYVHAGGATIYVPSGANKTWCVPLLAPTGSTIASITFPQNVMTNTNYIGPAHVSIIGAGESATAIMDFTDVERKVNGVIITSPGSGYDENTVVTVPSFDRSEDYECAYTLAAAESGGFSKTGDGTLTVTGENTYTGATRVVAGTLAFTDENGFPGGDVEFPASSITGAATSPYPVLSVPSLAMREGASIRVTGAEDLDATACRGVKTLIRTETPLSALPAVSFVDADGDPLSVGGAWRFNLAEGGCAIQFGYSRGTVLIVR